MLAKSAKKKIPAMSDLQRGGMTIHFFQRLGSGFREGVEVGLTDHAEYHKVALRHLHRVFDDVRSGGSFGEIGDPHHQTSAALFGEKHSGGPRVVGFVRFTANLRQGFDNGAQVMGAAAYGNLLLNLAAISEHANAISALRGNLRERQRRVYREIEFGQFGFRAFQPDAGA